VADLEALVRIAEAMALSAIARAEAHFDSGAFWVDLARRVPHSYPACSQHAPNEHLPVAIAREGLALMAGLYWDLGEQGVSSGSSPRP
jgi:hypothetical protein